MEASLFGVLPNNQERQVLADMENRSHPI